jgi:hypothetical protein
MDMLSVVSFAESWSNIVSISIPEAANDGTGTCAVAGPGTVADGACPDAIVGGAGTGEEGADADADADVAAWDDDLGAVDAATTGAMGAAAATDEG